MFRNCKQPYHTDVLLIKLRADNGSLEVVPDICHPRKTAQRRRKCLLHMAIGILGHFNLQSRNIQVGKHAIVMRTACIVEGDLETVSTLNPRAKSQ